MRKVFLAGATALAISTVTAQAGGVKDAVIAPTTIQQTATISSSSDSGLIVPLLLLLVIIAVTSGSSGYTPPV